MTNQGPPFPLVLCSAILLVTLQPTADSQPAAAITVDASRSLGTVGSLYNVGYDGWGDITNSGMIHAFNDLDVEYCRMRVDLEELCGDSPGDYRWDYASPRDVGVGFTDRVRKIIANGWRPLLAFSYHGGHACLPRWFHGEHNDSNGKAWVRYNRDGTRAEEGWGDQLDAAAEIARETVAHLSREGITGLHWETIYEMGHDMPLVEIHHAVATGIRAADGTAKIVGPATWPGWTVQERFVKPYLAKYGPDLLDTVSVHWYADNDHDLWKLWAQEPEGWILTLGHQEYTGAIMDRTGKYADWTRSLDALLKDPALNPAGKRIGISFTEIDVLAISYYLRNPVNEDWPEYRADRDCWLNTNHYGGVWWASVLCNIASAGVAADAAKFNTRNYYGLAEMAPGDRAYRYPVWFALKLLRDEGGLTRGRSMLATEVRGDSGLEAFATGGADGPRIILINKSREPQRADLRAEGLAQGNWNAVRFLFDQTRVAAFLGRRPGEQRDGQFEGAPEDDSKSLRCLEPVETLPCAWSEGQLRIAGVPLPPVSVTVLRLSAP